MWIFYEPKKVTLWNKRHSVVAVLWPATSWVHYTTSCNTQSSAPEDGQNNCPKHVELTGIINKPLLLHLVGCLYYLYQWCTVKQISDNEIYLLIKCIKSVIWRERNACPNIEDARCLKGNTVIIQLYLGAEDFNNFPVLQPNFNVILYIYFQNTMLALYSSPFESNKVL